MPDPLTPLSLAGILFASMGAGAVNAIAGGGTLLTFPVLLAFGVPPIVANATSTVGLVLGSFGSVYGYRRELSRSVRWLPWLLAPSVLGGLGGALLLLETPPSLFEQLVPALLFLATFLFVVQGRLKSRAAQTVREPTGASGILVALLQLPIALYGGYFGAGIGILMLATLGLLQLGNLHVANGLKSVLAATINLVAAVTFIVRGAVDLHLALVIVVGSTFGGYFAAEVARTLPEKPVRLAIVTIGLLAAIVTAMRVF